MRRGMAAALMPPKKKRAKKEDEAKKPSADIDEPKVDAEKLVASYPPLAEPEKDEFVDERVEYYRKMAKAIWLKCSDCASGQAFMSTAGYLVPKCVRQSCSLYTYRDEFFKEEIRRGYTGADSDGGKSAGDGRKRTRAARTGRSVRRAAAVSDNEVGGSGVRPGPGDEKNPGVSGAPGTGASRKSRRGASGSDSVHGGGGDLHPSARKTRRGVK